METFEIFAEMSIAMLGFSGLMVAISDVSSIVVARVKGLLFFASIAAICSVIPHYWLSLTLCSLVYIVLVLAMNVWSYINFFLNPQAQASKGIYISLTAALISAIIVLTYCIFYKNDLLLDAYIGAISVALLCSGTFFVRMVLFLVSEKGEST